MEKLKIGFKEFEIKEKLDEKHSIVIRKDKEYMMKTFQTYAAFSEYLEKYTLIRNSGVKVAKVIAKDKNNKIVIEEYIKGENVLNLLVKEDLDDIVYDRIFMMSYIARTNRIVLDFDPSNYIFSNDGFLYYVSKDSYKYEEDRNFIKEGIRLWFYTKEFTSLLNEKNIPIDSKRIKEDFVINKEIVLKTIKYYR